MLLKSRRALQVALAAAVQMLGCMVSALLLLKVGMAPIGAMLQ